MDDESIFCLANHWTHDYDGWNFMAKALYTSVWQYLETIWVRFQGFQGGFQGICVLFFEDVGVTAQKLKLGVCFQMLPVVPDGYQYVSMSSQPRDVKTPTFPSFPSFDFERTLPWWESEKKPYLQELAETLRWIKTPTGGPSKPSWDLCGWLKMKRVIKICWMRSGDQQANIHGVPFTEILCRQLTYRKSMDLFWTAVFCWIFSLFFCTGFSWCSSIVQIFVSLRPSCCLKIPQLPRECSFEHPTLIFLQ